MKKYQIYIARLCFSSFIKTLAFLAVIIICIKTLNLVQKMTQETTVDFKTLGMIVASVVPHVVVSLTPFALSISCTMVFSSMLSSSQITVLQNAGVKKLHITLSPLFVLIPIAVCVVFLEAFVLTYTTGLSKKIQHNIVAQQTNYFLMPNKTKTFRNVTIITSPLNKEGKIPKTFVHKQLSDGFFALVGKVDESWSMQEFLGLKVEKATVISKTSEEETVMFFDTLETQLDLFTEDQEFASYSALSTPLLVKEYKVIENDYAKKKIIRTINDRITPSFAIILIPFAIITLLVKFHNNRRGVSVANILKIILLVAYCLFSCYNLNRVFSSIDNFYYIYTNIFLTFLLVCFLNTGMRFFQKNV